MCCCVSHSVKMRILRAHTSEPWVYEWRLKWWQQSEWSGSNNKKENPPLHVGVAQYIWVNKDCRDREPRCGRRWPTMRLLPLQWPQCGTLIRILLVSGIPLSIFILILSQSEPKHVKSVCANAIPLTEIWWNINWQRGKSIILKSIESIKPSGINKVFVVGVWITVWRGE